MAAAISRSSLPAFFAGLGAQVTLVCRGENILRGFDDDVRQHLRMEMERHGIHVVTGNKVAAIERHGAHLSAHLSGGNHISADCIMFALGRVPNVSKLGLKEAGVEIGKNGGIAVDEYSRTSSASIYAVGDVTNRVNLTPVAIREGHAFATACSAASRRPSIIPMCRPRCSPILRSARSG